MRVLFDARHVRKTRNRFRFETVGAGMARRGSLPGVWRTRVRASSFNKLSSDKLLVATPAMIAGRTLRLQRLASSASTGQLRRAAKRRTVTVTRFSCGASAPFNHRHARETVRVLLVGTSVTCAASSETSCVLQQGAALQATQVLRTHW